MSELNRIRVLIVDDHDMLREGLASFIRAFPDLIMVGDAAGGSEAIRMCRELQPDVVLMDLMMPEIDGITVVETIHRELPAIRFIALSSFSEDKLVKAAFRAGVTGFLLKILMQPAWPRQFALLTLACQFSRQKLRYLFLEIMNRLSFQVGMN